MSYSEKQIIKYENWSAIFLILIIFTSFIIGRYFVSNIWWINILLGIFLGGVGVLLIFWRDGFVVRERNYVKGLHGESEIEKLLKSFLPLDYKYIPDIFIRRSGNLDFLILGPKGIFGLEVKNYSGKITYDQRRGLLRNGFLIKKSILKQVKRCCVRVRDDIKDNIKVPTDLFIQPVLSFFSQSACLNITEDKIDGVYVLESNQLIKFLTSNTVQNIEPKLIEEIYSFLK